MRLSSHLTGPVVKKEHAPPVPREEGRSKAATLAKAGGGGSLVGVAVTVLTGYDPVVFTSFGMKLKGGSLLSRVFATVGRVWFAKTEESMRCICDDSFFDSGTCWLPAGVLREDLGRGTPL